MKFYYLLGYLLRPFGLLSLYAYSIVTKNARVRVVIHNEKDEILLVRTWLGGDKWGLPGGGVHSGEKPEMTVQRELREETGLTVPVELLEQLLVFRATGHDEIVFTVSIKADSVALTSPNKYEIKDIAWFSPDELPSLEPLAKRIMHIVARNRSV
jgi:ADP-ribose pyrophosphatase YjhB (NUDIX family)